MLKHVDLCSGIGGFALGFGWAELSHPVLFCDIEPWSRKILAKHWPDVKIAEDVKELANDPDGLVPDCDILTAGYPCQPFSVAGKQRGEEDDRHIWPEIFRIIKAKRPNWIVCENVYGHISLGLDEVLFAMESLNYHTRTFVLPSSAIGARHKRERLWIICRNLGDPHDYGFPTTEKCRGNEEDARGTQKGSEKTEQSERASRSEDNGDVSNTDNKGFRSCLGRSDNDVQKESGERRTDGSRSSSHDERSNFETTENGRVELSNTDIKSEEAQLQRQQGLLGEPSGKGETDGLGNEDVPNGRRRKVELRLDGVVDGVSYWMDEPRGVPRIIVDQKDRANRLKALGNAIVPQNAKLIGLAIKKELGLT